MGDEIDTKPQIPTPRGLGKSGRQLWRSVLTAYELRPDELVLLENAAKTADFVAQLDEALKGAPLVVKGSMGQERENPLLSERRQQSAHLARLIGQLKLPDIEPQSEYGSTNPHRRAAAARWQHAMS
ncbi:MAG TPA: hypothetical protein VNR17_10240 [Luteimicrobium sp.]|nr:hypothetical protein [Luteimicrobium sp.]